MKPILFHTTNWNDLSVDERKGETGVSRTQTLQADGFRVRLVEYSSGYKADHWCKKGHLVFCLEGEMTSELSDGRMFSLKAGMSYAVSDNVSCHRSHSSSGVKLMIIDGDFLHSHRKESNPWRI